MRGWVRGACAGLASGVALAAVALVGADHSHPVKDVRLSSGAVWLPSAKVGQLTLLDGASVEVAAQVPVATAGSGLDVVQRGSTAYAVDHTAGTISRVSGATFEVSAPESPIPDARGGLTAFAGTNALYALDTQRGVLATADPETLARKGDPISLATQLTDGSSALDEAGRLWLIDTGSGDLTRVDAGARTTRRGVTPKGPSRITIAGGRPVVVDPSDRKAIVIDPSTMNTTATLDLDLRPDDRIEISGSPHSARLYAAVSRGLVTICDLSAVTCAPVVPLTSGNALGAPVETGNRLFVPDYTSGQVWVIDLTGRRVLAKAQVLTPPAKFQLLTRDGLVFYNDPDSERAGVIRLDGTVVPAAKYDPKDPDKGTHSPPNDTTAPPASATPPPAQPPPSQQPPTQQPVPTQQPPSQQPQPNPQPNPQPPPSGPGSPPPTTPPPKPQLTITLSTTSPAVGDLVTMRVSATNGTPRNATWTFGDGQQGSGTTAEHSWAGAQTFQVGVQVTMQDGQSATASASVTVSAPANTTVPTVIGKSEQDASTAIRDAFLVPAVQKVASNTIPAGQVIDQSPAAGTQVASKTRVTITVSSGPTSIDLIAAAANVAWKNGNNQTVPFNGAAGDPAGWVKPRQGVVMEDGSTARCLELHGDSVRGVLSGTFNFSTPFALGDHFRAKLGMIKPPSGAGTANGVIFSFTADQPNPGSTIMHIGPETETDHTLATLDIDLKKWVGGRFINVEIQPNSTPTDPQDLPCIVDMRIEGVHP